MKTARVFYGWWIVAVGVHALTIYAGAGFYASTVFLYEFTRAGSFGWTRAEAAWGLSLWWVAIALISPVVGKWIDVHGAKRVMLISAVATGTVLVLLSQVRALWHLYLLYSLLGVAGAGLGVVAVGAVVAKWFRRKRGLAAGVAVMGIGLGAIVMIPLAGWLISTVGWRPTYVVLGVLTWVTLVPAVALIVRSEPRELGLRPDGDAAVAFVDCADGNADAGDPCIEGQKWTLPAAMCTPAFWLIAGSMFLCSIGVFGVLTHQVAFLTDMQLPVLTAAAYTAFTGGMGVPGKLAFGYLADRFPARYVAILNFSLQAVAVLVLLLTKNVAMLWLYMAVFGFSAGGYVVLQPVLVAEFFGVASVGAILGVVVAGVSIAAAIGPIVSGYVYGLLESYHWAFVAFIGAYALAVIAVLVLRVPRSVRPGAVSQPS